MGVVDDEFMRTLSHMGFPLGGGTSFATTITPFFGPGQNDICRALFRIGITFVINAPLWVLIHFNYIREAWLGSWH